MPVKRVAFWTLGLGRDFAVGFLEGWMVRRTGKGVGGGVIVYYDLSIYFFAFHSEREG